MLQMHYKHGHTTLNCLQDMDTDSFLPRRLADCTFPVCADCLYINSIERPCNTKTERSTNAYKPVESVGECVYFNVLVSSTPGIIAHMYEFITRQHYQYACMFVDHYYDFAYVHIIKSKTGDEAVGPKEAFESYTEYHGVDIKDYHSKNGISEVQNG